MRDAHVLGFAIDFPWAVERGWLPIIATVLARHAAARDVDEATMQAALISRRNLPQPPGGGVAVIPVYGMIAPRANAMTSMSGGTSFQLLGEQLSAAMADPKVKTIVLDVDSPGGSVAGAAEFAAQVRAARTKKPIIAQAEFKMGSAAYWLSASATKIFASQSASVGAIGVFAIHNDISKALADEGVKRTYISAGKHKVTGNEAEPLTDETLALLRQPIDAAYKSFINDISIGRGVKVADVRNGFGEGLSVGADEALALGMIDGIATLEETITRAQSGDPSHASAAAATTQEPSRATVQELQQAYQRQAHDLALLNL